MSRLATKQLNHVEIRIENFREDIVTSDLWFGSFAVLFLVFCGCWCLCAAATLNQKEVNVYHKEAEFLPDEETGRPKAGVEELSSSRAEGRSKVMKLARSLLFWKN